MSIGGRVALGVGLVLVLAAALVWVQLRTSARLTVALNRLAAVDLPVTSEVHHLASVRAELLEHIRKYEITRDPRYAAAAVEASSAFATGVERLQALGGDREVREAAERLASAFADLPVAPSADRNHAQQLGEIVSSGRSAELRQAIADLEALVTAVAAASRVGTARGVTEAVTASDRALRTALFTLLLAALGSIAVVVVTTAAIRRPLGLLVAATRALAAGRLEHRIPSRLPAELADLAADFNTMADRLQEAERTKRRFLSHVSHEIRTPLVAMGETSRLLLDEVPGPLNPGQRRVLELHLDGHRRLEQMISNLLSLSRIEAGVFEHHLESQDLAPLVRTAAATYEASAQLAGLELRLDVAAGLPPVCCDRQRLLQVLHNLLANAIRHSPEGGTVTIGARLHAGRGRVTVSVSDRGPGIPADLREQVLAGSLASNGSPRIRPHGSGLGLTICHEIVRAHGGQLRIEDAPGGGARFAFDLAAAAAPDGPGPPPAPDAGTRS